MKRVFLIVLVVLVFLVTAGAVMVFTLQSGFAKKIDSIQVTNVDVSRVKDGTYRGTVDTGVIIVDVDVKVHAGRIESIDLVRHQNGKGSAAVEIIPRIIAAQNLDVDTVSGATYSSLCILGAVRNGLMKGL